MTVPNVLNPFRDTAQKYLDAGFRGPLILPYKAKEKPPSAFTGRLAAYPDEENIKAWLADGERHNICVRLAGVDDDHELIGIDVDDYWKGDKKKEGASQLLALENHLGPLPNTWISSARTDGKSGIRYYRVPRGLAFRGKADKDIEVIQKRHRYAIVWPSIHPDGGTYWWFPPGIAPSKTGLGEWDGNLPNARLFSELPEAWVEFLSNNRLVMPKDGLIDMDTPVNDVYDWATDTFHGDDETAPCSKMREKLDKHIIKIQNSSTFHDLLINAHWNLLMLAFEGHHGWNEAVNELEQVWAQAVADRGGTTVRDFSTLQGEIFRSRIQALRQIKAKSDDQIENGAKPLLFESCFKRQECGGDVSALDTDNGTDDPLVDVPRGALKGVPDYEINDDGNAEHLFDMFSSVINPSIHFVDGVGWIIWHNGENPHWEIDREGDQNLRRMWHKVKNRQCKYAEACFADWAQKVDDFAKGVNNTTETDVKIAKALYDKWNRWSENSGNNRQAENAIKALRSLPGVSIDAILLDQNPLLLGVANGVVELTDQVILRKALPSDLITMNTGVLWESPSSHSINLWQNYLDTFLPNPELQKAMQVAMGYCLMGNNVLRKAMVFKGPTTSGKSTMIDAIIAALGDYGSTVNQSLFQNHKLNPVLGNALKKRFVGCSEFDSTDGLSNSQFKRITGGEIIQVELKNSNVTLELLPHFVPGMATNEVPKIDGGDKALEIRLHVFPFNVQVSVPQENFKNIIETVCRQAVLNWMIDGYKIYREMGALITTKEMQEAKKEFIAEFDDVSAFIHDCVDEQTSPQGYVTRQDMFTKYTMWCDENQVQMKNRVTKHMLTKRMKSLGYVTMSKNFRVSGKLDYWWMGVRLRKTVPKVTHISGAAVALKVQQEGKTTTSENPI